MGRLHTPSFEELDNILLSLALFYSLLSIGRWFYSFAEMISPFMHTYTRIAIIESNALCYYFSLDSPFFNTIAYWNAIPQLLLFYLITILQI